MDCSLPGSSICGIFQARVLQWVSISFSRGSSQPRDQTWVPHIASRHFTIWATWEAKDRLNIHKNFILKICWKENLLNKWKWYKTNWVIKCQVHEVKGRISQRRFPGGGETGKEKRGMCFRFEEDYVGGGKAGDKGWDGWIASATRWTWVWTNSRRQWRTGKHGMLQSTGSEKAGPTLAAQHHRHWRMERHSWSRRTWRLGPIIHGQYCEKFGVISVFSFFPLRRTLLNLPWFGFSLFP